MLRAIAQWWAKRQYIWKQECEAATAELGAGLSLRLASEKRALIAQLNKDAEDIENNIKSVDEKMTAGYWECANGHEFDKEQGLNCPACNAPIKYVKSDLMTGQEKYESDKERTEAEKIAENKRATAKAEEENAAGSESTAKYFQDQAKSNRQIADKIRSLRFPSR